MQRKKTWLCYVALLSGLVIFNGCVPIEGPQGAPGTDAAQEDSGDIWGENGWSFDKLVKKPGTTTWVLTGGGNTVELSKKITFTAPPPAYIRYIYNQDGSRYAWKYIA
jgi:hypothetical protein